MEGLLRMPPLSNEQLTAGLSDEQKKPLDDMKLRIFIQRLRGQMLGSLDELPPQRGARSSIDEYRQSSPLEPPKR